MSRPNQYSSEKRRKELEKKRKKEEKAARRAELKLHPELATPEEAEQGLDADDKDDDGSEAGDEASSEQ